MTQIKKWQILQSHWVINQQWCRVRQDKIKLPSGDIINDFFVNVRPDIALVLPITNSEEIVFVRQYRHGIQEILLELPAGTFYRDQESGESAAKRELLEETGYISDQLIPLAILHDNPVKDTNQIHLFLAKNLQPSQQTNLDITEEIEVVLIPISEVMNKIRQGEICVCGSLTAIFLGLDYLQNQ